MLLALAILLGGCLAEEPPRGGLKGVPKSYPELEAFFLDWRSSLQPKEIDGVPDYSLSTMTTQYRQISRWKKRLEAMAISDWPVSQQVDWYLVWSEMNAMIFAHRVKKPWQRDPAFYIWYVDVTTAPYPWDMPRVYGSLTMEKPAESISMADAQNMKEQLEKAPILWAQAQQNLTGSARDLWLLGEKAFRQQSQDLRYLSNSLAKSYPDLAQTADQVANASDEFADWLLAEAESKTETSGVGRLEYTWNLRNVHLLPYSWSEERMLVEHELARTLSQVRLAQDRNRSLSRWSTDQIEDTLSALPQTYWTSLERRGIRKRSIDDSLRRQHRSWATAYVQNWLEPGPQQPNPDWSTIRRMHRTTNLYDARMPSGLEEILLQNALSEKGPRSQELVWMMLAQRAAYALGALEQHGLEKDHQQATREAAGWIPEALSQLTDMEGHSQLEHRYLQHAGLGTSYVVGRQEVERMIAVYARQHDGDFSLANFVDAFDQSGPIPLSLIYWEVTGDKSLLNATLEKIRSGSSTQ